MLTPVPHTPLAERLREEGRLLEAEYSGNNSDDEVQLVPKRMTPDEMQRNYYRMLESLFGPGEIYHRAGDLIDRLNPHIFRGGPVRHSDLRAALRSLWRQGFVREKRARYFGLLMKAYRRDLACQRAAARAASELGRRLRALERGGRQVLEDGGRRVLELSEDQRAEFSALVDRARDTLVRARPDRRLAEVRRTVDRLREDVQARLLSLEDARLLYRLNQEFYHHKRRVHRFPGAYLVKAFELAIKGLHYETVMYGIVRGR
jgi:hypothetical protein